jgi:hypothetical protein
VQVRGPDALRAFSKNLLQPYVAPPAAAAAAGSNSLLEELQRQLADKQRRIEELEAEVAALKAGQ